MLKKWIDRRIEIVFQEMTLESFSCQALSWFPVTRGLRLMCTQLVMEEVVAVGREASGGELQCRADPAQASHHTKSNSSLGDSFESRTER